MTIAKRKNKEKHQFLLKKLNYLEQMKPDSKHQMLMGLYIDWKTQTMNSKDKQ